MKTILLTRGHEALVDDEDYEWLSKYTWHTQLDGNTAYAFTCIPITGKRRPNGKQDYARISMHQLILCCMKGEIGEHRNRDGLDNQRSNLRKCTQAENNANKVGWGASRFKGVSFHKRIKKWQAYIQKKGKRMYLGYFKREDDAAHAYDEAAQQLFGEYARTNF